MDLIALSIEQNCLRLQAVTAAGVEPRASVPVLGYEHYAHDVLPNFFTHLALRQWGKLIELTHGTGWTQSAAIYRSSDGGRTLTRVEPPPSAEPIHKFTSGSDGTLLGIADWRHARQSDAVWVRAGGKSWHAIALPRGFQAEGVSRAKDGTIYVAGGQLPADPRGSEGPRETLLAIRGSGTRAFEPPLAPDVRAKIHGVRKFAEHLTGVDATGEPLVVRAPWGDGGHECVLIVDEPHWNALKEQLAEPRVFRDRPGAVTVYDALNGRRFRTRDRGRSWAVVALMPAIQRALKRIEAPSDRLVLADIDVRGDSIALIARPAKAGADAILVSNDDGKTFGVVVPPGERTYQRVSLPG